MKPARPVTFAMSPYEEGDAKHATLVARKSVAASILASSPLALSGLVNAAGGGGGRGSSTPSFTTIETTTCKLHACKTNAGSWYDLAEACDSLRPTDPADLERGFGPDKFHENGVDVSGPAWPGAHEGIAYELDV